MFKNSHVCYQVLFAKFQVSYDLFVKEMVETIFDYYKQLT